jgi:hypothetical protein
MARIDIRSNGAALNDGVLQLENGVAMDATLRNVADQNNTTSPLKLSTTAVQVTSPLRITTSDASGFYLDAEDSATNNRFSIKRDPSAQEVTLDFASNPAGSTTLVGAIRTYRDGVNLSNAMSFIEDGSIGVGTSAPIGLLDLFKSAAATRLAIRGDAGQNRLISYRTGALQRFGLYVNNTAESGSNAGSNFAIRAYSDAGALLSTPFFINRATGNVGVNTLTGTAKLQVVGSGSTSATTSLLVQNSLGTAAVTVTDDLKSSFGGQITAGGGLVYGSSPADAYLYSNTQSSTIAIQIYRRGIALSNGSDAGITITPNNGANVPADIFIDTSSTRPLCINKNGNEVIIGQSTATTNASSILTCVSTTKGFLPPRMTNAQRGLITTPAVGLMVYCTDAVEGLYVYKSTGWTFVI